MQAMAMASSPKSSLTTTGKRRIPGTPLGGERAPASPHTPEILKIGKAARIDISTPVPPLPATMTDASSSSGGVTMEAIAHLLNSTLDSKLIPIQSSIGALERQMSELNFVVDERFKAMEIRAAASDIRVSRLEEIVAQMTHNVDDRVATAIEQQMESLGHTMPERSQHPSNHECTAFLGGLTALGGKDEAATWLTNKMWSLYGPMPIETYCKKGDFKGILFAKFSSKGERDTALAMLKSAGCKEGDTSIYAKPDRPLEERTLRTFTFEAKKIMESWGWHLSDLWADPEAGTLKLAGETIITAAIVRRKLGAVFQYRRIS